MKIEWRAVLRDAVGVLLLGFLGALVGGALDGEENGGIRAALAIVLMTAGFCVSGCLAKKARFKHLVLVAVGVLLIGTIVRVISGGPVILSPVNIVEVFGAMLLGGLISLPIVRPPPASEPPAAPPPAAPPPA